VFHHLLVPLDGSRYAETALPAAAAMARRFKATVTLLHVVESNPPRRVHGQRHLQTEEQAMRYLKALSIRAFPAGVTVRCHVHGAPARKIAKSIVAHEEEFDHDLIVMCTHGRGGTTRLLAGSVAQRVLGAGTKPVLIVHPPKRRTFRCRVILAPVDDHPEHDRALTAARATAKAFGAALHLLRVIDTSGTVAGGWRQVLRLLPASTFHMLEMAVPGALAYLKRKKSEMQRTGLEVFIRLDRGNPAELIRKTADEVSADLIVLGTHGRFGMDAFWSGSVASRVCSLSNVPMLLIPMRR
jgi:nucleotide-binding universal stress UspA family protein